MDISSFFWEGKGGYYGHEVNRQEAGRFFGRCYSNKLAMYETNYSPPKKDSKIRFGSLCLESLAGHCLQ